MKITLRLIVSLLVATVIVVASFSYFQVKHEEKRLNEELRLRTTVLAKTFKEAIETFLERTDQPGRVRKFIEKFQGHKRLIGLIVDMKDGQRIALPPELAGEESFRKESQKAIEGNISVDVNGKWGGRRVNYHAVPLIKDDQVAGVLGLIHDRSFIVVQTRQLWRNSAVTFSILAAILSIVSLFVIRWNVTGPIARIASMVQKSLGNEPAGRGRVDPHQGEIEKLLYGVSHMVASLKAARLDLMEQSRFVNAEGAVWTKERLKDYLKTKLHDKQLYVVSNREPYIHQKNGHEIECITPASGVVTALDPVMQATGGLWLAHGAGNADREVVDQSNKVGVPPWKPSFTLKRMWLTPEEEKGYYYGFSNEGLWPLCHISHVRPVFRIEDWNYYQKVNREFADSLLEEFGDKPPMLLVQDYHFALLPRMIKEKRPDAKIALFWHIPWPNAEAFGICPWQEKILEGMLGSDLIGFHTQFHCNNFLDTVDRALESKINWANFEVTRGGKTSAVRPFPISISGTPNAAVRDTDKDPLEKLRQDYNLSGKKIGIGVDRIDYTKGLLERFRAIERVLEKYPYLQGELVFIELGAPSRTLIGSYQNHLEEVEKLVEGINQRFQKGNYKPILFLEEHHDQKKIFDFYRLADFCLVSSLHDGMNLVAKEFVSAREDEDGVLILSRFAGASYEFTSSLLVNPYDIEGTSEAIHQALTMLPGEKRERMRKMRQIVREYNVYRWAADMITHLTKAF
ncbi:MAG TPA: trehalose-6-phosphate synthase [Candidatus Omnitrophota bacterium]|jgi:trehalose 6-phosphate synthase|nr:trehalose-6-phosphate synthase [Candidatus Omnitrophota bacterium]HQB94874.1 trehalose-6-phosphate synthase [Candidatus Omnitrophota bacterium]